MSSEQKSSDTPVTIDVPPKEPFEGKATQKQKQLIWELGVRDEAAIAGLGKKQASIVIQQLKAAHHQVASGRSAKSLFRWAGISALLMLGSCAVFATRGPDPYGKMDGWGAFSLVFFLVTALLLILALLRKLGSK